MKKIQNDEVKSYGWGAYLGSESQKKSVCEGDMST